MKKTSTRFLPRIQLARKSFIGIVAVVVITAALGTALSARAALLPRVNDALTKSGFALTFSNWKPFATGVVTGHYRSFDQLADAAKWHKQQGTLPQENRLGSTSTTTVGKVAGATTSKTSCLIGTVKNVSLLKKVKNKPQEGRMTVQYEKKVKKGKKTTTSIVNQAFKLSKKQYDVAIQRGVVKGRQSKVCTKEVLTGKTTAVLAGNALNLSPAADPDDSSGGGSGGSNEGGGGANAGS
jgi:hypothetical protein